jgi:signal transduction histidine kinase
MVAHEFRTPLTGIQGFSEIIRDYDLSLAEIREYASDISSDARRLGRMINAQLDLDRMIAGSIDLAVEPVDLNALAADLVEHISQIAQEHAIELSLAAGLPAVWGDRDRLIQVASNLLTNATKYSPDGGAVTVATRFDDEAVELAVTDRGIGIAPENLERVFQPYTRIEHPNVAHVAGTGLGLPIVRQIVELHGGRVWVESELGKGSTFRVRLPARQQKPEEIADGGDRRLRRRPDDSKTVPRGAPADAA